MCGTDVGDSFSSYSASCFLVLESVSFKAITGSILVADASRTLFLSDYLDFVAVIR